MHRNGFYEGKDQMNAEHQKKSNMVWKRSIKRVMVMTVVLGILICLSGCHSVKPEDMIEQYAAYADVTEEENRLGIDIAGMKKVLSQQAVHVTFTNSTVFQEDNINLLTPRFYAYNAENMQEEIELTCLANDSGIILGFPEDMECDYLLIMFVGIPESDVASIATPTCGFIVQLDKYGTNVISGPFVLPEIES